MIISPDHWAIADLGQSADWSALSFWAIPTSLETALETEIIICREQNRFLIIKWKSGMGRSLLVAKKKKKVLILREKGIWWGKKHDSAKMVFVSRHHPIKRKFFLVCLLAVLGKALGNNTISVASGNCQSCYLGFCCSWLFVTTFLHLPAFLMNKHTLFFNP